MVLDRSESFRVNGLAAIRKELKGADDELLKKVQAVNKEGAETVAEKARGRVRGARTGRHGESGLGRLRASIKARATATSAKVEGGNNVPTFFGEEFGGSGKPKTQQFPPRKKEGYFLFPTVRDELPEIMEGYLEAIDKLFPARQPGD